MNIYPVSLSSGVSRFTRKASVTLQVHEIMKSVLIIVSRLWQLLIATFGPGGPWMPGCPCMHLQGAGPSVRPISAYPPHCQRNKDLDKRGHTANRWLAAMWSRVRRTTLESSQQPSDWALSGSHDITICWRSTWRGAGVSQTLGVNVRRQTADSQTPSGPRRPVWRWRRTLGGRPALARPRIPP